jgi:hypothetical protein
MGLRPSKVPAGAWSEAALQARGLKMGPPPGKGWMTRDQIAKAEGVSTRYASIMLSDLRVAGRLEQEKRLHKADSGSIHCVMWFRLKKGKGAK